MKIQLLVTPDDHRIAKLAAVAIGLTLAEAALPSPLPGVKPGLANIVTLAVLARFGLRVAIWVGLLRVVAGSLLMGTFLSPTFFLSSVGAIASFVALAAANTLPARYFGPITLSVFAAFAHLGGQLALVYFWLIPHAGVAYLLPLFAGAALVFGTANGIAAAYLLERISANTVPLPCAAR